MFNRHGLETSQETPWGSVRLLLATLAAIFAASVVALRWTTVASSLDVALAGDLAVACFSAALATMAQLLAWDHVHQSRCNIDR